MKLPLLPGGQSLQLARADGVVGGKIWPAASALCQFLLDRHHHHQHCDPSDHDNHPDHTSKRPPLDCVELGSGTGAVGLYAAAALGYAVTLTERRPPLVSVLSSVPYAVDGTPEWMSEDEYGAKRKSHRLLDLLRHNVHQNRHLFVRQQIPTPRVMELDWNNLQQAQQLAASSQSGQGFELVLASDVTYDSQLHQPLSNTIATLLSKQRPHVLDEQCETNNNNHPSWTPQCWISHQERIVNFQGVDFQRMEFQQALALAGLTTVQTAHYSVLDTDHDDHDNGSDNNAFGKTHKVCILQVQHTI